MQVFMIKTGMIPENAYVLMNDQQQALIVDPGENFSDIQTVIQDNHMQPLAIVLTHTHYDHIGAVDALRDAYEIPVYVHEKEADFLMDPQKNLSINHQPLTVRPADVVITETGSWDIEGFLCRVEHIPGHSPGSIVYIFEDLGISFVGDTLFKGGCGRTDLPYSSSHKELMQGIEKHLMTLPDDMVILSGHGDTTTIAVERKTNPYLNGVTR